MTVYRLQYFYVNVNVDHEKTMPLTLTLLQIISRSVKMSRKLSSKSKHRVTLEDVASAAGVSAMTVSRVVNHTGRISSATRQRVWDAIEKLEYRPSRVAQALVTKKTMMIGTIIPDINNPYFAEIIQGVEARALEEDYRVLLANTNEDQAREETALRQFDEFSVDGVIVCSRLPDDALIPLVEPFQAAVVINRQLPKHVASSVRTSQGSGYRAFQSALYLAQAGHKQFGYVHLNRGTTMPNIDYLIERLKPEGIVIRHEWCISCQPNWQSGYEAGHTLLERHPYLTAVIGGNDLVALGVMRAAIERGRHIPKDLAIIGGDDILMASQVTPSLTTFTVPKFDIGFNAAHLLLKRIAGNMDYQEYLYEEIMIERASTS